jgi:diguanylate cyclase (GGDEF)-like protein
MKSLRKPSDKKISHILHDPQTGLLNRTILEEMLNRELIRSARHCRKLGLILSEIDQLSEIAETLGTTAVDMLLHDFGKLLNSTFRTDDMLGRFSQLDFIIALPETSLNDTLSRAVELQDAVRSFNGMYYGHSLPPLTLSLGIASFPKHGLSMDNLLKAVQLALVDAKKKGKNLVAISSG